MPLIETVSLLTALANAYQVLRSGKQTSGIPNATSEAVDAPGVVFAYDLAKTTYDSVLQRIDSVNRHLNTLAILAGIGTLTTILAVKAVNGEAEVGSPLLLAALVLFMVTASGPVLIRAISSVSVVSTYAVLGQQLTKPPLALMEDFVRLASTCTDHNEKLLRLRVFAGELLLLCLAANVLLLAVWALSA